MCLVTFISLKKSSRWWLNAQLCRIPQNEGNTLNELICDNLFAVKLYSFAWNYHLVMTHPCWKDDLQFLGKQPHPLVGLSYLKFHTGLFCEKVSKIIWTKKVFYDKSLTRFAFPKLFSKSFAYYKSMLLLSLENIDFFTLFFCLENSVHIWIKLQSFNGHVNLNCFHTFSATIKTNVVIAERILGEWLTLNDINVAILPPLQRDLHCSNCV
jgi:hypothetical protein